MEFDDFPSCEAWTKASLQRFARGPEVMTTLSKFLQEKVELENKLKKCREDFIQKWNKTLNNEIGSNLQNDDVQKVMKIMMAFEGSKTNLHCQTTYNLQNVHGPIPVLDNYMHSSSCMVDIMNMKSLYNDTMSAQKKLESNIETGEKAYLRAEKKKGKVLKEIDELGEAGENSKVKALTNQLKPLTYKSAKTLDIYSKSILAERRNRTIFRNEMIEFHTQSTRYETIRLETVKITLQKLLSLERESEEERVSLKEMLNQGLLTLERYDIQAEIDEFDQLCRYQHQFPQHWQYEEDSPKKEAKQLKNDEHDAGKTDKNNDEVEVLMVPKEDDDVLFVKSTKHPDIEFAETQNLHQTAAKKCDAPASFDLPNIITDDLGNKAPKVNTTTIDIDSDSSSEGKISARSHAEDTEQMKIKVYGLKSFCARTDDEISFKKGSKVYMTQGANEDGRAYGYIKKGKLRKKKVYGFFPAKLVSCNAKKGSAFKPRNPFKKSKDY